MILTCILAARLLQSYSVDPAVDAARKVLGGFGVTGTRLHTMSEYRGGHFVEMTNGKGVSYRIVMSAKNRCTRVDVVPTPGLAFVPNYESLKGTRYERLVRDWLGRIGTKQPVRLEYMQSSNKHGRAFFAILRNGYSFVSGDSFGYSFTFSMPDGAFEGYEASEATPPVSTAKPVVTLKQALNVLDSTFKVRNDQSSGGVIASYKLTPGAAIGYYASGTGAARLVWRIPFMANQSTRLGSRGSSSAILVDAVTGKQIPTKVVP